MKLQLKPVVRGLAVAFGGLAAVTAFPAVAQQQQLERVEITGSLLRRVETETALPVTILRADDLAKAGVSNAEQAVRFIAQNAPSITTADSVGSSVGGAAYADLRGLGVSRTLVLVNGKRMVNNPYDAAAVDLNALPMVAIDRIEVLTDGASAIYGTDAIAGVINFITRKTYEGFKVDGDVTIPEESGGKTYSASVGAGFGSLSKDGWNVYGGLSYRKQDPLKATERDFAKSAIIPERGVFKASPTTFPANYTQGATVAANPTGQACDPPFSLFLPDVFGPDACGFDYVPFINVIPEQEQLSFLARGSLAFGKSHTVSLEYLRADNTVDSVLSPTPLSGLSMSPASPFYPGKGITPANPALDTSQPISLGWRTTLVGGRASRFENTTDRWLLDLSGQLWDWDYRVAAFRSESTVTNTFTGGYLNNNGIRNGLNGTGGAPFLNPFGPQSDEGAAYVQNNLILGELQEAEGKLSGISAQAGGELFQLPAGPLSMAVGAEFMKDEATYTNNFVLIRQAASSGLAGAEDAQGDRDIWAVNFEFNIPIIKNLDLNLAARYDDYSDFGNTFNPKIAVRWQAMQNLLVRGSYNTGFRAPTLYDVYSPQSLTFTGRRYNDPVLCPNGVPNAAAGGIATRDCNIQFQQQLGGNPNLQPEESDAWTIGFVMQPTRTTSFSIDYWDYKVTDSIGGLGESTIFGDTAKYANLFVRCSQAKPSERELIDACRIPGGDPLAYIVNTSLNLGDYKTSGLDFAADWRGTATSYGTFSAGIRATYVTKFEYQFEPGGEFFDNLGDYFNGVPVPRFRYVLNVGWQMGGWSAQMLNRYSRGYNDANAEAGVEEAYYNRTRAYSIWDLSVTYTGIKGLTVTGGVLNLFNTDPPFSNQGDAFQVGYDQRIGNPIGRAYLIRLGYEY